MSVLQAMIKMFDPVLTWAARKYQAAVATELKKYGLRYEDLYDPQLNMVRCMFPGIAQSACNMLLITNIHCCIV